MNIVDFHIHGIGSNYKDDFATASYDQICAYFENYAQKLKHNVVIALTEHDVAILTYQQYKDLSKKYPHVKIIPGMESNTSLETATDGIFETAHILNYADVSSDESVKKWFDCAEIKYLTNIKTYRLKIQYPSFVQIAGNFCKMVNAQLGTSLNSYNFASKYIGKTYTKDTLITELITELSAQLIKSNDQAIKGLDAKDVLAKVNTVARVSPIYSHFYGLRPSANCGTRFQQLTASSRALERLTGLKVTPEVLQKMATNDIHWDNKIVYFFASQLLKSKKFITSKKGSIYVDELNKSAAGYSEKLSKVAKDITVGNSIKNLPFQNFNFKVYEDHFGERFYTAKNLLNKKLGLQITNKQISDILDSTKSYAMLKTKFVELLKQSAKQQNQALFGKICNLAPNDVLQINLLNSNDENTLYLQNLFSLNRPTEHPLAKGGRTPLEDLAKIKNQTGGYLLLAHPICHFKMKNTGKVGAGELALCEADVVTDAQKQSLLQNIRQYGKISCKEIESNSQCTILKLDMFFKLCQKNNINFDGYEVSRGVIADRSKLINYLIYAAKTGKEISYGSDTHLSSLDYYYQLLKDGKITQSQFTDQLNHAIKIGDSSAKTGKYKTLYTSKISTGETKAVAYSKHIAQPIKPMLKSTTQVYPYKDACLVTQTSFCDKVLGSPVALDYKPILTLGQEEGLFEYNASDLKKMHYNFELKKEDYKKIEQEKCEEFYIA